MAMSDVQKAELKAEKAYARKHKRMYRLTVGDVIFNIINYTIFAVFTFACFFPFWYLFCNTVSDSDAVSKGIVKFFPQDFTLENYKNIITDSTTLRAFFVTLSRTILGTAVMVIASALIGYLVTKKELWGRKVWYRLLVITMYFNAGIIPWYMNMSMLGLTGNYLAYIIPGIVAPYNIILVKTYIESIPAELEESAFIDGASHMKIFRSIIWPLCKPILATIAIFGAVGNWNSFQDSLILMSNAPELHTLQHKLYIYLTQITAIGQNTGGVDVDPETVKKLSSQAVKYTVSMATLIPILIVYPFMQRYFEEGIMLGAVKG